jgi:hypothetical protein
LIGVVFHAVDRGRLGYICQHCPHARVLFQAAAWFFERDAEPNGRGVNPTVQVGAVGYAPDGDYSTHYFGPSG